MSKHLGAGLVVLALVWVVAAKGVTLAVSVAVVTAAACAALLVRRLAGGVRLGPWHAVLGGLVAWSIIDAVLRPVAPGHAAWLVATGLIALELSVIVRSPRDAAAGRLAVVLAGAVVALWVVGERIVLSQRPGGPFADPNLAATAILLALALLPTVRLPRGAVAVLAVVAVSGVVASTSRAGLLAAMALAVTWLIGAGSRAVKFGVLVVLVALVVGLAGRMLSDRDPLRWERIRIWRVAVETITAEAPLGAGPGGFRDAATSHNFARQGEFARFARIPSLAENDLLQVAASLGVPGLVLAVWLAALALGAALSGSANWGAVVVVLVTSTFHSQLAVPVIAWLAVLAIFGSGARTGRWRCRTRSLGVAVAVIAAAGAIAVSLGWPRESAFPIVPRLLDEGRRALAARPDDARLATAENSVWLAARLEPDSGEAWRLLAEVRLQRATIRRDPQLATAAESAWQKAADLNRNDAWAQFGLGRTESLLGRRLRAAEGFRRAVEIEPNCVPAWLELSRTHLELGRMNDARNDLARARAILEEARGRDFVSDYERAMANADPWLVGMLRSALEGRK